LPNDAQRFWLGEGAALRTSTAEEILRAMEDGAIGLETPMRVAPDAAPRPLARFVRELVWTARREQSEAEPADRGLFQAAFQRAPIGMVLSDLAGRIQFANDSFAFLVGYPPDELTGVRVGQLSDDGPNRTLEVALGNELMAGLRSSFQIDKVFRHQSGALVETLTAIALVHDDQGAPTGVVAHVLDLRELKSLEGRLAAQVRAWQESEERFERLFRFAPQAMLMVDADGLVVQSNEAARALFAAGPDALDGSPVSALLPAELRTRHEALVAEAYGAGRPHRMAQGRTVRAHRLTGEEFFAHIGLVPVDLGGREMVLAGVTDVSAQLAAQATVERSLREKETLLREIHHRVKNNLQMVSSLLMLRASTVTSAEARLALEDSVARVRSMALIHQQLYGLESLSHIDLGIYVQQLALALCGALAPGARLFVSTPAQPVLVAVDLGVPLGLILNELVTNALKYGFPPALRDGGETPAWDVCVQVERSDDGVRFSVEDRGPGLPVPASLGRDTLGMELVRSLVRQLRGTLTFESPAGARVVVSAPLTAQGA
jgi:PAS domain S-box-containing protein